MRLRPPVSTRTDTLFPDAALLRSGRLRVERGFVKPEDEPVAEPADGEVAGDDAAGADHGAGKRANTAATAPSQAATDPEEEESGLKPMPDRLVSDLTAWRPLALQIVREHL